MQEQPARSEASGETGAAVAPQASSKLVLVVGGTDGVGKTKIPLLSVSVPSLQYFSSYTVKLQTSFISEFYNSLVSTTEFESCGILNSPTVSVALLVDLLELYV